VSGRGFSWAICKSAPRSKQITTPTPYHSVFTGRMPFLPPNQQRQSTEGKTLKAKTVHKITEYLTLWLLPSLWSIYHSTTAYFFDPPCTPYFSLYYCILAVTHSCHKLLMSTFNKDQWWWWHDDDDVCLCDGRLLRRHMLSPHQPLSVVSCCFYCFKLWRVTVWISPG